MSTLAEQYRQLLAMTQSHLLTEFPRDQRFISDPETVKFYKSKAAAPKMPPKPPIVQQQITQRPPQPQYHPPKPAPIVPKPAAPPPPPLPAPAQEKKPLEVPKRERLDSSTVDEMSDIRSLITKLYPQMHLSPPPASDNTQTLTNTQTAQVYVLQCGNTPSEETFLHYLAEAIKRMLAPAMVVDGYRIEKENRWEGMLGEGQIKLIVMTETQLQRLPSLQGRFQRSPTDHTCRLGEVPLLLIPELRLLFQQPDLKISLWHTLQALMKNNASQ